MKANELMINDWVYLAKGYGKPKKGILKIDALDLHRISDGMLEVEPIPLTPEILEKNGFVESHVNGCFSLYTLIYDGISFSLKYVRSVFQWLGPLDFKYVHELQHALRLCGIKKEIEL